jgi:hypothetical protein
MRAVAWLPAAAGGKRPLQLERYDSKGQNEEALSALRAAIDDGAQVVLQGNSSATAAVLIDAINKHNEREPEQARAVPQLLGGGPDPHQRESAASGTSASTPMPTCAWPR